MKTYSLSLQKGGTGNTSLSVAIAAELAREVRATILLDCDPQGNSSGWLHPEVDIELADLLINIANGKTPDIKVAAIKTGFPGLSIIPTKGLDGNLKVFQETMASAKPYTMQKLIKALGAMGYHYCVMDLSPAFGPLEKNCLLGCDEFLTPTTADIFGPDGLLIFAENLKTFREDYNTDRPTYRKIIINEIDRRIPQHEKSVNDIKANAGELKIYSIPTDPIFRKAQGLGIAIQALNTAKLETRAELHRLATDLIGA